MIPLTPDQLRIGAREATYANSQDETSNVARVDGEVFDRVRTYERQVISNALGFIQDAQVDLTAADELETRIRQEVRYALDEGSAPDAVALLHQTLVASAREAIRSLEAAERQAAWHEAHCSQPYEKYVDLVTKYPTLRPAINV
jgi:hypothetical protein